MNIFFVDRDPQIAARSLIDKHVVKMVLETAQILSTICHRYQMDVPNIYKSTHKNHPAVKWAGNSIQHFEWLRKHGLQLCSEYTHRYNRTHKSEDVIREITIFPYNIIPNNDWIDPPLCMPDEYKTDDTIESYRNYYTAEKLKIGPNKGNYIPEWYKNETRQVS